MLACSSTFTDSALVSLACISLSLLSISCKGKRSFEQRVWEHCGSFEQRAVRYLGVGVSLLRCDRVLCLQALGQRTEAVIQVSRLSAACCCSCSCNCGCSRGLALCTHCLHVRGVFPDTESTREKGHGSKSGILASDSPRPFKIQRDKVVSHRCVTYKSHVAPSHIQQARGVQKNGSEFRKQ